MLLVDTKILVDVLENDPAWVDWSIRQLRAQAQIHALMINPIIYAELSLTFATAEALDATLDSLKLPVIEIPKPALSPRSSLRAERGNPVMKPARSAVFEPRTLKDAHSIATSPAAPLKEQIINPLFFLRRVPGPKGLGSGLAMTKELE